MGDMTGSDRNDGKPFDENDGTDPFADLEEFLAKDFRGSAMARADEVSAPSRSEWSATQMGADERAYGVRGDGDFHDTTADELEFESGFADALDAELEFADTENVIAAAPKLFNRDASAPPADADRPQGADSQYASWLAPKTAAALPLAASSATVKQAFAAPSATRAQAPTQGLVQSFDDSLDSELQMALDGLSAPANPRQAAFHRSEAFAPARVEYAQNGVSEDASLDDFDELIASELAAMRPIQAPADEFYEARHASFEGRASHSNGATNAAYAHDAGGFDGWDDEDGHGPVGGPRILPAAMPRGGGSRIGGRSWGLGASLLAIAVVGGLGAYVMTGDTLIGAPGEVLIVKADTDPVKVAPKDPGGRSIPNQNKAVYERVQSAAADIQPVQKTLLTAVEEPVALPQEPDDEDNGLPGVDLSPIASAQAAEPATQATPSNGDAASGILMPQRVRTLTVRPDGTLVVENAAPAAGEKPAAAAPAMLAAAARPIGRYDGGGTPLAPSDVAPAREDPAPVQAQAEAAPTRVAAIETPTPEPVAVAAPAPSSEYYVQISSQPSEEAAKQSQRNLGQRYASVIGSRNLTIQTADIAGKGTYYRVRIGAASRDEANSLCASLKSAGGSCFVSR